MNNPLKKNSAAVLIGLTLNVLFLAVVIYEIYLIKGLYSELHQPGADQKVEHIVHINFSNYSQAIHRYQNGLLYEASAYSGPDPFNNAVDVPVAK